MTTPRSQDPDSSDGDAGKVVQIAVRLTAVALLAAWCFIIVAPFVGPIAWGVVIAVATVGPYEHLVRSMGGRSGLAACAFVLIGMAMLVAPMAMLSETLVSGTRYFASHLGDGTLVVPPPPEAVAHWPVVGAPIYAFWKLASENLQQAVAQLAPQLQVAGGWLLGRIGSATVGILQFVLSIVIAGFILANHEEGAHTARLLAHRIAGDQADDLMELARATVSSVALGILGVAIIQSLLAGMGFLAAGVPAAGLWAVLVLVCAIVQLPVILVMAPIVVWEFSTATTVAAVMLLVWTVIVSLLDNVLKPILFGRGGAKVPVLVIFIGSIGGIVSSGIIGLFTGAVVLAVGYTVFRSWLRGSAEAAEPEASSEPGTTSNAART